MKELDLVINKPLIVGDIHFSEYSSIIRKKGLRLSHIVNTLKWVIDLAHNQYCDSIIFLGDFFDKPELNAAELTALQEVKWPTDLNYICLVGNHEMGAADLSCSSTHILNQIQNFHVIDEPTIFKNNYIEYLFIPYLTDDSMRKLDLYCPEDKSGHRIIFSHNDIKGVNYGKYVSKQGFDIDDIHKHCVLFLNGHLHNRSSISEHIHNVGNIIGQNFSEDAFIYPHCAIVLPINDWILGAPLQGIPFINPYAFNFYKIDATKGLSDFYKLEDNAIVSVRCYETSASLISEQLEKDPKILEYRLIVTRDPESDVKDVIAALTKVDHIEKFKEYIINELGSSEYVVKELQELCQ